MNFRFLPVALTLVVSSNSFAQKLTEQFPVRPSNSTNTSKAKTKRKAQVLVARKGAFPVVKMSDASLKKAVAATNLGAAQKLVGKGALIVGTVTMVYAPKSGARVLLNFAPDYKKAVVGLIDARNFAQFPDLRLLTKKRVLLSGRVLRYKDQIEIDCAQNGSIRVIQ